MQDDSDFNLVNVTYCVSAIDIYNAILAKCQDLKDIINKVDFLQDYSQVVTYLSNLTFKGNITNILFASNVIH